MGDRKPKHPKESSEYAKELLQVMLNSVPVRNEIIVQICKQCNNNPREYEHKISNLYHRLGIVYFVEFNYWD